MDFWKFQDLLTKSALYFTRQDRFPDQFEGRFTEGNSAGFSESDKALYEAYRMQRSFAETTKQHELHRKCVFISCWHRNAKESWQMWRAYASNEESVVITSSAKALYRFVPAAVLKSPVSYRGHEFRRTDFGWNSLSFFKLSAYSFEHEFRMLRTLRDGESVRMEDSADYGRLVQVPVKKIIHRVVTHPAASDFLKKRVDCLLRAHLKGLRREDSTLSSF